MPRDQIEPLTTRQFTITTSVAPDSAPILMITNPSLSVVASITATSSDSTNYYALYTTTSFQGVYKGLWYAEKTVVGSVRQFRKSFIFNNIEVKQFF